MCYSCWEEINSPKITNNEVIAVAKLIKQIYEYSSVGGNLHIVLDDWNLRAADIDWCIRVAIPDNIRQASEQELAMERECATRLRRLPIKQRATALAINDGYLAHPNSEMEK